MEQKDVASAIRLSALNKAPFSLVVTNPQLDDNPIAVSEMLTNSLQQAFDNRESGEVKLRASLAIDRTGQGTALTLDVPESSLVAG